MSLAVLFAAAQLADLLWPVLVAFGLERVRIDPGNTAFTPPSRARDKTGRWAFLSLAVFLTLAYFANVFGGAPPSVVALYSSAIVGGIILMLWGWWVDRHREPAGSA